MRLLSAAHYRCPLDGSPLTILPTTGDETDVVSGRLESAAGRVYAIENGLPLLTEPEHFSDIERQTQSEYDRVAEEIYDRAVDWQFASFYTDENTVREAMVDLLDMSEDARVLEIGCGTGRDSYRLARRLGPKGQLHMQDLSRGMVEVCRRRMAEYDATYRFTCGMEYSVSSATALPYPDDYFDAVFHFGGFNHFGDLKNAAAELTRVVRRGGRVLYGDEAVAPWLKGSEFDGIVSANNPLFKASTPLDSVPASARDVTIKWLIANCFYVIAFTRGQEDGPPPLDLDMAHTGVRGGTMRSRYFGVLEGVSLETKALVREAAAAAGVSIYEWLDTSLKAAAEQTKKQGGAS